MVHYDVGDSVLVRGSPARVRMETATQVLVLFEEAEHHEEWVPKNSSALTLAKDAASLAARAAAASAEAAAQAIPADHQADDLSDDREDDECFVRPPHTTREPMACPRPLLLARRCAAMVASSRAATCAPVSIIYAACRRPTAPS